MEVTYGSEHVVGLRLFGVKSNELLLTPLTTRGSVYLPGEVFQASCNHAKHLAKIHPEVANVQPNEHCMCGVWSCKSRSALTRAMPMFVDFRQGLPPSDQNNSAWPWDIRGWAHDNFYICARVEQWGVVIEHEDGYRSEFARIIPETISAWPRNHVARQRKLIRNLRKRYMNEGR